MAKMKAVQVPKPGGGFEVVEREIPQPDPGHVRIRVQACGVCHSEVFVEEGLFPGISYPRVPGHEVAGVIDEVRRCDRLEEGRTRRRRLAWRPGWYLSRVQEGRFPELCECEGLRD